MPLYGQNPSIRRDLLPSMCKQGFVESAIWLPSGRICLPPELADRQVGTSATTLVKQYCRCRSIAHVSSDYPVPKISEIPRVGPDARRYREEPGQTERLGSPSLRRVTERSSRGRLWNELSTTSIHCRTKVRPSAHPFALTTALMPR